MIRKIEEKDRKEFLRLSKIFYASAAVLHDIPERFHEKAFEEMMRSDIYAEGYLFEEEGKAAGYALNAKTYSREAGGMVLWLEELFILPEYRSRGLGRTYFALMEERAVKEGFARIRLEVEEDNVRARALYERLGYIPLAYGQMVKELHR